MNYSEFTTIIIFLGYKCEVVEPNQLKMCWPAHPGDIQGTYQVNQTCEGVVNDFTDTQIVETHQCNSTIGIVIFFNPPSCNHGRKLRDKSRI